MSLSAIPKPSHQRILELDGLRGIAIGLVLAFHIPAFPARSNSVLHFVPLIQRIGWSGVDLFFVLSGFLIGGILLDARTSGNYFRVFYARRFFRIIPLYLLLLLIVWGVSIIWPSAPVLGLGRPGISHLSWMAYLLLIQNFSMTLHNTAGLIPLGVTWSLAVEEQFYLSLPVLIRYLSQRALYATVLSGILLSPILRAICYQISPTDHFSWFTLLPCRADTLLLGVLVALLVRDVPESKMAVLSRRASIVLLPLLSAGVICLAFWAFDFTANYLLITFGMSLLAIFYAVLLLCSLRFPSGFWGAMLRWRPLRSLGTVAYGMYLFHTFILQFFYDRFFMRRFPSLHSPRDIAVVLCAFASMVAFCALSWRFFEAPLLRIGHHWKYTFNSVRSASPTPSLERVSGQRA